ncbi:unnamed protein product [Peronospora belbahrii]|uniref:Uncharacterized protein n=1 Tax=Peronospora belbahrii TaxID=622444 RepID=A0ABN8CXC3_9STRA|nr:unnamed protein product [Peronospora belbahrii]
MCNTSVSTNVRGIHTETEEAGAEYTRFNGLIQFNKKLMLGIEQLTIVMRKLPKLEDWQLGLSVTAF